MKKDVIASISTPLGRGAIAVVRMSGKGCLEIALKIFHLSKFDDGKASLGVNKQPQKGHQERNVLPRFMYFGKLDLDGVFEECLMVYFKAPFSYTGEDVVEFQVHGGVLLAQKVLEKCLSSGARLAEAGEFSKRAFLNGKISLDKAEAIIGEINAETEGELRSNLQVTNGRLANEILQEQNDLTTLLAEIEVGMDYPDETEETELKTDVFEKLREIKEKNLKILQNSESAKYLKNGINVALVGKTNVGKSSVMNALLGEDRAIVTDIQGTTRDTVTESLLWNGVKINLVDTAGIRETADVVESLGIAKSKQSMSTADVVLFVLDGSEKETEEDRQIEEMLQGRNVIVVVNKSDKKRIAKKRDNEIEISALVGKNIDKLKKQIVDMVIGEKVDVNALVLTNERQCKILKEANDLLENILQTNFQTLDVLSMLIKQVWQTLGKITGNTENEDIINLIFSKFCLGK